MKGRDVNERIETWQRARVGDEEIEFTQHGTGDAVFLVHAGVFSDWFRLVSLNKELAEFCVIRPRRVGYGQYQPTRHLTLADHAQHAAALADRLELKGIHWVGHSSSCLIGLSLAVNRPELVLSLTLMEPSAGGGGFDVPASFDRPDFVGPALSAYQAGDLFSAFDHFMRGVCGDGYREILEARLGRVGFENAVRESAYFFRDEVRAVLESRFSPVEAAKISQPVLCVEGGAQPPHLAVMARQVTKRTVQFLPQTQVVVIPGVNHALPLQDPDAVAVVIASFLKQVTKRPA